MKVVIERETWMDFFDNAWGGACDVLEEVQRQGREEEAMQIIEEYNVSEDIDYLPTDSEINNFIGHNLADIMNLYRDSDDYDDDSDWEDNWEDEYYDWNDLEELDDWYE